MCSNKQKYRHCFKNKNQRPKFWICSSFRFYSLSLDNIKILINGTENYNNIKLYLNLLFTFFCLKHKHFKEILPSDVNFIKFTLTSRLGLLLHSFVHVSTIKTKTMFITYSQKIPNGKLFLCCFL